VLIIEDWPETLALDIIFIYLLSLPVVLNVFFVSAQKRTNFLVDFCTNKPSGANSFPCVACSFVSIGQA
jgi:hypothetical protein